jgi:dTDP-4-dehydrorhamnose 3,5-epimerase
MQPTATRPITEGGAAAAFELAKREGEPLFVPSTLFADDRGWSLMNQLQGVMGPQGQINFSVQYPGVIKAWHRHSLQTDFWMCVHGHMKVGVHREEDGASWLAVIGEKRPGVVIIPPPLWHGAATVGNQPAGLLYYVTHAFNPKQPDEQRRAYDSVEGFPWAVRHG